MKDKNQLFLWLFLILSALNLVSEFLAMPCLIYSTKPALLTLLSLWFYGQTKDNVTPFSRLILIGLIFSIFGDSFLMFTENGSGGELFFLLGLGSFLITHLSYFFAFKAFKSEESGLLSQRKIVALPFVFFLLGNTYLLWRGIPADMKIPVLVYSSAITAMALAALNLQSKLPSKTFQILFSGVLLFLISDTFIGINKFHSPLPYARLLIMIPYLLGQYLIAKGAVGIEG